MASSNAVADGVRYNFPIMDSDAPVLIDETVVELCREPDLPADAFFDDSRVLAALPRLHGTNPSTFLRSLRPGPEGDLVASALLRLLGSHPSGFTDNTYRNQVALFVDSQYASNLAPYYTRPSKSQTHEVISALMPVVPALEQRAAGYIARLQYLDRLESVREEIMRLLNGSAGRVVFQPFLPQPPLDALLQNVFSSALDLRAADDGETLATAYRRVASDVTAIEVKVDAHSTTYARRLLLEAGEVIRAECRRRLELTSPPARLSFRAHDRPLPLLEPGVTCDMQFTVTNEGDAPATNVTLTLAPSSDALAVTSEALSLGPLHPHSRQDVTVALMVKEPRNAAEVEAHATWTNLDHTIGNARGTLTLAAQEVAIDWDRLEGTEPYAPYPVERADDLVGRERELLSLRSRFTTRPLANLYVTGQRRVGKTSLVRVLLDELKGTPGLITASVEMGEARAAGAATIGTLGKKLADRTVRATGLMDEVTLPTFESSLAPLTDVVDQLLAWDADLGFLFVIDEFDELPHETYRRDGPGDALFVPMRSLAQKPNVGWLLVGGEKMPFIRDEQAARLNTFKEVSVDYLSLARPGESRGFHELVRQPLPSGFSVDEAAVRSIYHESAGNPHFAKEICTSVFSRAVARRDAVVTSRDVDHAIDSAARERDVEIFAHFWEDGIFEVEAERRRKELERRAFLTACAETLRATGELHLFRVKAAAAAHGMDEPVSDRLHVEFVRRAILEDVGKQELRVHVPFFQRWLEAEGIYRLPPTGIAEEAGRELAAAEQRLRISGREIRRFVDRLSGFAFRGQKLTRDEIEVWLSQYDTPLERRLLFRFLERLNAVSDAEVFEGFRRLHRLVARDAQVILPPGQRAFTHVYVSALGGRGSSGDAFTYMYRQANNISGTNIVQAEHLAERLMQRHEVNTVVLVDDFIGSGKTAAKALGPLAERARDLARSDVNWFLFAVAGLMNGVSAVESSAPALELGLRVEIAQPINPAGLPFSAESTVFPDPAERNEVRRIIEKYGKRIKAKWPLGYGNQAVPVVFPDNCPNNAPAILWSDGENWRPLFSRTGR